MVDRARHNDEDDDDYDAAGQIRSREASGCLLAVDDRKETEQSIADQKYFQVYITFIIIHVYIYIYIYIKNTNTYNYICINL